MIRAKQAIDMLKLLDFAKPKSLISKYVSSFSRQWPKLALTVHVHLTPKSENSNYFNPYRLYTFLPKIIHTCRKEQSHKIMGPKN